jgi:hypothetical protein
MALSPDDLRDLANVVDVSRPYQNDPGVTHRPFAALAEAMREEAARREAEAKPEGAGFKRLADSLREGPGSAADEQVLWLRARADAYQARHEGNRDRVLHDDATAHAIKAAADRIEAQARHVEHWRGSFINEQKANEALKARVAELELDGPVWERAATFNSARADRAEARVARLEGDMQSIREYWNGSQTDGAMSDALAHIIGVADAALAEAPDDLAAQEVGR